MKKNCKTVKKNLKSSLKTWKIGEKFSMRELQQKLLISFLKRTKQLKQKDIFYWNVTERFLVSSWNISGENSCEKLLREGFKNEK